MSLTIGSRIERKRSVLTWHYRNADPETGIQKATQLQTHLEREIITKHTVEILTGNAIVEVRPCDVNKGEVVGRLVKDHSEDLDFVFCAGDDITDEGISYYLTRWLIVDMFRQLRKVNGIPPDALFSTMVGAASKLTLAKWYVTGPADIVDTMARLAGTESEGLGEY